MKSRYGNAIIMAGLLLMFAGGASWAQSNTALGGSALSRNTTGSRNTAIGSSALRFNTTGSEDTAVGAAALEFNTTGFANTASGAFALQRERE
jgi:hypothetical protein